MASIELQLRNLIKPLTKELANAALRWTQENYKQQQWEGTVWRARQKETRLSSGKPILTARRNLYNALQVINDNAIGVVGIPYARIHNDGGSVTHPARQRQLTFKRFKSGKNKGRIRFAKNNSNASFSQKVKSGPYSIPIPRRRFIGNNAAMRTFMIAQAQQWLKSR